jgi:hypothetical protein
MFGQIIQIVAFWSLSWPTADWNGCKIWAIPKTCAPEETTLQ